MPLIMAAEDPGSDLAPGSTPNPQACQAPRGPTRAGGRTSAAPDSRWSGPGCATTHAPIRCFPGYRSGHEDDPAGLHRASLDRRWTRRYHRLGSSRAWLPRSHLRHGQRVHGPIGRLRHRHRPAARRQDRRRGFLHRLQRDPAEQPRAPESRRFAGYDPATSRRRIQRRGGRRRCAARWRSAGRGSFHAVWTHGDSRDRQAQLRRHDRHVVRPRNQHRGRRPTHRNHGVRRPGASQWQGGRGRGVHEVRRPAPAPDPPPPGRWGSGLHVLPRRRVHRRHTRAGDTQGRRDTSGRRAVYPVRRRSRELHHRRQRRRRGQPRLRVPFVWIRGVRLRATGGRLRPDWWPVRAGIRLAIARPAAKYGGRGLRVHVWAGLGLRVRLRAAERREIRRRWPQGTRWTTRPDHQ